MTSIAPTKQKFNSVEQHGKIQTKTTSAATKLGAPMECSVPQLPVWICLQYIKKRENIWFFEMQNGKYHKIKLTDLLETCPGCGGGPIKWSGIRNKRRSQTVATLRCNRQGRGRCDYLNARRRTARRMQTEQLILDHLPTNGQRQVTSVNHEVKPFVNFMNVNLFKRGNSGSYDNEPAAKIRKLTNSTTDGVASTGVEPSDATFKLSTSAMDKLAVVASQQIFSQKSHPAANTGNPQIVSSIPRVMQTMSKSPDHLTQQDSHPAANTGVPQIKSGAPRLIKLTEPTNQNKQLSSSAGVPAMESYALRAIKLMSKSDDNPLSISTSCVPKMPTFIKMMPDASDKTVQQNIHPVQQNSHPAANTGAPKMIPGDVKVARHPFKMNPQIPLHRTQVSVTYRPRSIMVPTIDNMASVPMTEAR